MKLAFIGYGNVGGALADRLQRLGHAVTLASSDPSSKSVAKALARNPSLAVTPPAEAVDGADSVPALLAALARVSSVAALACCAGVAPSFVLPHATRAGR